MSDFIKEKVIACVAAVAIAGTIVLSEVALARSYGSTTPTSNPLKAFSKFEQRKWYSAENLKDGVKGKVNATGNFLRKIAGPAGPFVALNTVATTALSFTPIPGVLVPIASLVATSTTQNLYGKLTA